MRIAIVLVTNWWRASIDLDGYAHALKKFGCEPLLVCRGNDAGPADFDVVVASEAQQEDADFWKQLNIDAALIFSWLQKPKILRAMKTAGVRTVSRADSDGLFSSRVFPRETLRQYVTAENWVDRAKQLRHFLRRNRTESRAEDAETLDACACADAIVIETEAAKSNLAKFFAHYQQDQLTAKVHVLPHTVDDSVLKIQPGPKQSRQIFCGGRWDDVQKNAPLLKQTIEKILKKDATVRFVIAGSGAATQFSSLASNPRVHICGVIPRAELLGILADCNFILSSSKWESHPVGTLEALCCGGTAVATPLPGFVDIIDSGRFGTLSTAHSAGALSAAVLAELKQWDTGNRDPAQIASHWKKSVNNEAVMAGFLTILHNL